MEDPVASHPEGGDEVNEEVRVMQPALDLRRPFLIESFSPWLSHYHSVIRPCHKV